MNTATDTEEQSDLAHERRPERPIDQQLERLAERVLAYAKNAKVRNFRYCKSPLSPSSPHDSLLDAIHSLKEDLKQAANHPICQTLAIEFLRELAALGHQPPCQNAAQQKATARIINSALLELR